MKTVIKSLKGIVSQLCKMKKESYLMAVTPQSGYTSLDLSSHLFDSAQPVVPGSSHAVAVLFSNGSVNVAIIFSPVLITGGGKRKLMFCCIVAVMQSMTKREKATILMGQPQHAKQDSYACTKYLQSVSLSKSSL